MSWSCLNLQGGERKVSVLVRSCFYFKTFILNFKLFLLLFLCNTVKTITFHRRPARILFLHKKEEEDTASDVMDVGDLGHFNSTNLMSRHRQHVTRVKTGNILKHCVWTLNRIEINQVFAIPFISVVLNWWITTQ